MNLGVLYAVLAYVTWGMLPLYWKLFDFMPALDIMAYRIIWSFVLVAFVLAALRRWKDLKSLVFDFKTLRLVVFSSMLISINWLLYIWAVNNGHVIQASLGYYINPLLNVLVGVMFLKEKMNAGQWVSIGLAFAGVLLLTVSYGTFPWIAVILALSFALYGLMKKKMNIDAILGLAGETAVVLPAALTYLLYVYSGSQHVAYSLTPLLSCLLILSGAATALPLYWFAQAASRLSLITVGIIQYVSPTISLLLGVVLFKEVFTMIHAISFTFIWGALVIFTWSSIHKPRIRPQKQAI